MGWQCLVLNHLHGADLVGHFDVGRHDGDALSLAVDVIQVNCSVGLGSRLESVTRIVKLVLPRGLGFRV